MKKINLAYWIVTALFAAMMLSSAIPDILSVPMAVQGMHEGLGYPVYFIPFIGVAKALGVLAILIPVHPRLREWAYAGLFFDLIGATYSIMASGHSEGSPAFMLLPFALAVGSYLLYRRREAVRQATPSYSGHSTALAS